MNRETVYARSNCEFKHQRVGVCGILKKQCAANRTPAGDKVTAETCSVNLGDDASVILYVLIHLFSLFRIVTLCETINKTVCK